ncbi:hypothetical protein FA13DRAFT_1707053 [Coprinellus micaceus]|uniref:Uncharacterized protein n=1 Tax=Coprinellus micaceus TaxID=71717 RepID=A0A4Y7TLK7_COPMI|nr:hypothetical protein FA13DRAFT_1707053 [Coprinellus micaceus]
MSVSGKVNGDSKRMRELVGGNSIDTTSNCQQNRRRCRKPANGRQEICSMVSTQLLHLRGRISPRHPPQDQEDTTAARYRMDFHMSVPFSPVVDYLEWFRGIVLWGNGLGLAEFRPDIPSGLEAPSFAKSLREDPVPPHSQSSAKELTISPGSGKKAERRTRRGRPKKHVEVELGNASLEKAVPPLALKGQTVGGVFVCQALIFLVRGRVRSGELFEFPLAVVVPLLHPLGEHTWEPEPVKLSSPAAFPFTSGKSTRAISPILLTTNPPISVGDIHGQYHDLPRLFKYGGFFSEATTVAFRAFLQAAEQDELAAQPADTIPHPKPESTVRSENGFRHSTNSFTKFASLPGFTGSLTPGISLNPIIRPGSQASVPDDSRTQTGGA